MNPDQIANNAVRTGIGIVTLPARIGVALGKRLFGGPDEERPAAREPVRRTPAERPGVVAEETDGLAQAGDTEAVRRA